MLDDNAAWAIAEGRHGDPFSVLGPHLRGDMWEIVVLVPGAVRITVLLDDAEVAAVPHETVPGIFTHRQKGSADSPPHYRLRAETADATWEFDDPYRFGPVIGELDEYLFGEGTHHRLWKMLGAHVTTHEGVAGVRFAVWAPNAARVSVVGDFNTWNGLRHPMRERGTTGVWEIFMPGIGEGEAYKYEIRARDGTIMPLKADPVGFGSEHPPRTASVVRTLRGPLDDDAWMKGRATRNGVDAPISIYEVHLGSWKRAPGGRMLSYEELAHELVDYALWMGFTHVEFMPVSEYPFDGSWGYQPVGLFAPTIRHGTPEEFRALVTAAHDKGLGVILDWVPGHFPTDAHGLGHFDGTALYEHADPREGFHQDWNTLIYNYGRTEVRNFLIANALYWLMEYHVDGLRVDAVASMLYRDYSRREGEWVPNREGGRENYEAMAFLRDFNAIAYGECPGIMTAAEESTSFPGVSRAVDQGGLGFGFKWNMGWMNDTLRYVALDPVYRKWHHNLMTFALVYAWSENFILPISHDEVVHGKGSMLMKMPGSMEQKFANLRAYYGFMWGHPGKKLLFMGQEFAQSAEWSHDRSLDWHESNAKNHRGVQLLVRDLNALYRDNPAMYRHDTRPAGFEWIEADAAADSLFAWARKGEADDPMIVCVANMTPVERRYRLGMPAAGAWEEILNTDAACYDGGNRGNLGGVVTEATPAHGRPQSALLTLPPLTTLWLRQTMGKGAPEA